MKLYHGSNIVIEHINLAMCRPFKDFGKGFWDTDNGRVGEICNE